MPCPHCEALEKELKRTQARLEWQTHKALQAQTLVEETHESIDKLIARLIELWDEDKNKF
jgi:hypothetical protein